MNCLPLAAAFMAGVIVGRVKDIEGKDLTAEFFARLTRTEFGQEQYRFFVRPDASQEAAYEKLSIKSIARIAIDRIVEGARLALQAIGQAA